MPDILTLATKLSAPFDTCDVRWRLGSTNPAKTRGEAVPYVDARTVQQHLDDVVGPENWRNRYIEVLSDGKLTLVRCALAIRVDGEWVEKEDAADIKSSDDGEEGGAGNALKGVYSTSLKRVAVQWGVGRYLYRMKNPWVDLDDPKSLPREFDGAVYLLADASRGTEISAAVNKPVPVPAAEPVKPEPVKPEPLTEVKPVAAEVPALKTQPTQPAQVNTDMGGLNAKQLELVANLRKKFSEGGRVPAVTQYLAGASVASKLPANALAILQAEYARI